MKEIKQETNRPKGNLPYQDVNRPFRMQFVIPGPGITIEQDKNGVLYISAQGGASVSDIIAGDNIEIEHREDGSVVISAVNSVTNITAGENVTITVDPETGASVINSIIGGETNEHYKGVFDTTEDLIAADPEPEIGDYGLIKSLTITNGETSWSGQYKYCFYINGAWTVVDQMLTFTKNLDLLQQYYSVGGSSPVIYLHEIARSGNFWDLNNIPIVATPEATVEGKTITVTCETEGAEIWYSTDGSMPHVNGTKYTGPIAFNSAATYRFVGIKNGMINSMECVVNAGYELEDPVITFDWHTGKVLMTNPNKDGSGDPVGSVFYTLDGSDPTSSSTKFVDPFLITMGHTVKTVTVKAVVFDAVQNDYSGIASLVVGKTYISYSFWSGADTGEMTLFGTVVEGPGNAAPASDGELRYTLDGSVPDYSSDLMESRVEGHRYGNPQTAKLIGFRPGCIPSNVGTVVMGYEKPSSPLISFDSSDSLVTLSRSGNVMNNPVVPLKTDMNNPAVGCRIYYTLDGSTPTDQSTLYTGPFQISESVTVKAVLVAYGEYSSDVSELEIQVMDAPQFSLDWHTGRVTMTNPNEDGSIYYTLDGSEPTSESSVYSSPVLLTNAATVKAKVISENGSSATAEQAYTKAQAPLINDGNTSITWNLNKLSGNYSVKMTTRQTGGVTKYTSLSEGYIPSDPTWASQEFVNELSAPFFDEMTFKARTFAEGYIPSAVTSMTFGTSVVHPVVIGYDENAGTVSFTRQWFTAQIPLQTNNNTPELGCRVYYTLDGTTPDDTSTLWDGNPVSVAPGTTVKALLVCYGQYESDVATYNVPGGMEYMYLEAAQANSTVSMVSTLETAPDLEYSTDGVTWQEWQHTSAEGVHTFDTITLGEVGDKVYFRGDNPDGLGALGENIAYFSNFVLTGAINAGGNIMSILDMTMALSDVPQFGLLNLFAVMKEGIESALLTPPSMDTVTTIGKGGCSDMYNGCTSLTAAANMPLLTTIGEGGCDSMYKGCTSLTAAADMPSLTTIGEGGCEGMYNNCIFNMSDDGSTLNFAFPTPPVTAGEETFATAYDVAEWMGNTNGFNPK